MLKSSLNALTVFVTTSGVLIATASILLFSTSAITAEQVVVINPVLLDHLLNSRIGTVLLDEISQAIHTPSAQADRQALRSALIISASGDRQLTLIESIENHPTSEVEVEGDRLKNTYASTPSTKKSARFTLVVGINKYIEFLSTQNSKLFSKLEFLRFRANIAAPADRD